MVKALCDNPRGGKLQKQTVSHVDLAGSNGRAAAFAGGAAISLAGASE
jgi:hypothetical protein